jgi:hypothetical protein
METFSQIYILSVAFSALCIFPYFGIVAGTRQIGKKFTGLTQIEYFELDVNYLFGNTFIQRDMKILHNCT